MTEPDPFVLLRRLPGRIEASLAVAELDRAGIPARMIGGSSPGMEAPESAETEVWVRREDAERAAAVLDAPARDPSGSLEPPSGS